MPIQRVLWCLIFICSWWGSNNAVKWKRVRRLLNSRILWRLHPNMMNATRIFLLDIIIEDVFYRHAGSDEQSWAKFRSGSSDDDGNARNRRNYANSWTSVMRWGCRQLCWEWSLDYLWEVEQMICMSNFEMEPEQAILPSFWYTRIDSFFRFHLRHGCFCEDEASREYDSDKWECVLLLSETAGR